MKNKPINTTHESGKICFLYLLVGGLWIFFSDRLVYVLAGGDGHAIQIMSTYKGWAYVLVTGILLYFLINNLLRRVLYLHHNDELTGCFNRRYLDDRWDDFTSSDLLPFSVIMADLDALKIVNDAFGHATGDVLLQKAATAIRSSLRSGDIPIRWGGDEFLVLLPLTDEAEARGIMDAILRRCVDESVENVGLKISLGWATRTVPSHLLPETIREAEDMMYRNKVLEKQSHRGGLIETIITTLHEKNPREASHSRRVGEVSKALAKAMGLTDFEEQTMQTIGTLHDIGKIAVDERILNKTGPLTKEEREAIQRHPEIGFRILSTSPDTKEIAEWILCHHERWDGTGYPRGLAGEEIPLIARIICIADAYDAMSSERPYRKPMSTAAIRAEFEKNAGVQFDPGLTERFLTSVLKE